MAVFNQYKPEDNEIIAAAPHHIRENFIALKDNQIVNAGQLNGLTAGNDSGQIPVSNGNLAKDLNAQFLNGNPAAAFAQTGHVHGAATPSSNGFMSNTDKLKLDGVQANAEVNQNSFANLQVGATTIAADSKTDTLEMIAGPGISLIGDSTNDRLTIGIDSVSDGQIGNRTVDQALTPNGHTGTLAQFLSWLANRIKSITGKSNWYDPPSKTIEQLQNEKVGKAGDAMSGTLAINGENSGVELGSPGQANTPYLDFHSGAEATDYDVRLSASGGSSTNGNGTLTVNGAELKVNANKVWHQGNDGHGSGLDADMLDGKQLSEVWAEIDGVRSKDLTFQPTAGEVAINFQSNTAANDKGYIKWKDDENSYVLPGGGGVGSSENGALIIGVENDAFSSNAADIVVLKSPAGVVLDTTGLVVKKCSTDNSLQIVIDQQARVRRAVYNDLAEMFPAIEKTEPGDVCVWDETAGGVRKATVADDPLVVGVHSDTFGFLLGGPPELETEEITDHSPIGLTGQIWVKARGVKAGDLLTTSDESGVAKKSTELVPGSVFAKALESAPEDSAGRIRALIMLR